MRYEPPLERGTLLRRYKRFLADVRREDGGVMTIHCPNTGSMKNCGSAGDEMWYSTSDNPKRKYAHTWELVRTSRGHYIGINTGRANEIIKLALAAGKIPGLDGYPGIKPEVRYGSENSRVDLFLTGHDSAPDCYVEVKSVTLLETPVASGVGYFPDAVSDRASKHVRELIDVVRGGERAVMCYCVQHSGIQTVKPARHIDPAYAEAMQAAVAAGVEVIAYKPRLSSRGIYSGRAIPVEL